MHILLLQILKEVILKYLNKDYIKKLIKWKMNINSVLLDIIEGKIDVKNYNEIRESHLFQIARNNEKILINFSLTLYII